MTRFYDMRRDPDSHLMESRLSLDSPDVPVSQLIPNGQRCCLQARKTVAGANGGETAATSQILNLQQNSRLEPLNPSNEMQEFAGSISTSAEGRLATRSRFVGAIKATNGPKICFEPGRASNMYSRRFSIGKQQETKAQQSETRERTRRLCSEGLTGPN